MTRKSASILRVSRQTCLLPGSSLEIELPNEYNSKVISVEPRNIKENPEENWLTCKLTTPTEGTVSVTNDSNLPVFIRRHDQICQIRHTTEISELIDSAVSSKPQALTNTSDDQSNLVQVDPHNLLNQNDKQAFIMVNRKYNNVFSSNLGKYNGHSGPFEHIINMGSSLPPHYKERVPTYNKTNLDQLQNKFDDLYRQGVFARPEDLSITAEYVSPSFLVSKSSGGHKLVTAFT